MHTRTFARQMADGNDSSGGSISDSSDAGEWKNKRESITEFTDSSEDEGSAQSNTVGSKSKRNIKSKAACKAERKKYGGFGPPPVQKKEIATAQVLGNQVVLPSAPTAWNVPLRLENQGETDEHAVYCCCTCNREYSVPGSSSTPFLACCKCQRPTHQYCLIDPISTIRNGDCGGVCDSCFEGTPPPAANASVQLLVPKVLRPLEPSNADRAEDLVSPPASPATMQKRIIEEKQCTDRVDQIVADITLESILLPEKGDGNDSDNFSMGKVGEYSQSLAFSACM